MERRAHLGAIARHFAVYGVGGIAEKLVAFLLIPVYTRYLPPDEYGVLIRALLIGALLGLLISGGMHSALLKFHADAADAKGKTAVYTTILVYIWAAVPFVASTVLLLAAPMAEVLLGSRSRVNLIYLALLYLPFGMTSDIAASFFRAMQRSTAFVILSFARFSLALMLNIFFVVGMGFGAEGVLWSSVIVAVSASIAVQLVVLKGVGFHPDLSKLRDILRYGLPLAPFTIFELLMMEADKFLLGHFASGASVGVYALACRLGLALFFLFTMPFERVWTAYVFDLYKRPEWRQVCARVLTYFMLVLTTAGLLFSLFIREIVHTMAAPSYWGAANLIPLIVLAQLFYAGTRVFNGSLLVAGATGMLSWFTAIGLSVNIGMNLVLLGVLRMGPLGAALSILTTYVVMAGLSFTASQRICRVSYEWRRVVTPILTAGVLVAAGFAVNVERMATALAFHALLFGVYAASLLLFRIFSASEKAAIREKVQRFTAYLGRRRPEAPG